MHKKHLYQPMKSLRSKLVFSAILAVAATAVYAVESKIGGVMKTVMKGDTSTYKTVCLGQGTDADARKLADCLKGLAGTKPPKGDSASWNQKTTALIKAAEDVAAKKPGALTALQKAGNCKSCHSVHKGN
jgi:hypothetical protein